MLRAVYTSRFLFFSRHWLYLLYVLSPVERFSIEFENRFRDFESHTISFRMVANPFPSDENYVQETVRLERIGLNTNNHSKDSYKEITDKTLIAYIFIRPLLTIFQKIKVLSMRILTLFGSTHNCEQTFSRTSCAKCSERSCLSDEHLHFSLRIDVTHFTSNTERSDKEIQARIVL